MSGGDAVVKRRTGGRSARVRAAVLDAALGQLVAHGHEGLTIANVARIAGVAETTVYRHWPTPADLAAGAIAHLAESDNPVPDTDNLEGDLRALLTQISGMLRRPEVERILRAAAALDPANAGSVQARKAFWQKRFAGAALIVERAVGRGELPAGTNADTLIEFLVAPTYVRLLLLDRPLDTHLLEESVRRTVAAFAIGS